MSADLIHDSIFTFIRRDFGACLQLDDIEYMIKTWYTIYWEITTSRQMLVKNKYKAQTLTAHPTRYCCFHTIFKRAMYLWPICVLNRKQMCDYGFFHGIHQMSRSHWVFHKLEKMHTKRLKPVCYRTFSGKFTTKFGPRNLYTGPALGSFNNSLL